VAFTADGSNLIIATTSSSILLCHLEDNSLLEPVVLIAPSFFEDQSLKLQSIETCSHGLVTVSSSMTAQPTNSAAMKHAVVTVWNLQNGGRTYELSSGEQTIHVSVPKLSKPLSLIDSDADQWNYRLMKAFASQASRDEYLVLAHASSFYATCLAISSSRASDGLVIRSICSLSLGRSPISLTASHLIQESDHELEISCFQESEANLEVRQYRVYCLSLNPPIFADDSPIEEVELLVKENSIPSVLSCDSVSSSSSSTLFPGLFRSSSYISAPSTIPSAAVSRNASLMEERSPRDFPDFSQSFAYEVPLAPSDVIKESGSSAATSMERASATSLNNAAAESTKTQSDEAASTMSAKSSLFSMLGLSWNNPATTATETSKASAPVIEKADVPPPPATATAPQPVVVKEKLSKPVITTQEPSKEPQVPVKAEQKESNAMKSLLAKVKPMPSPATLPAPNIAAPAAPSAHSAPISVKEEDNDEEEEWEDEDSTVSEETKNKTPSKAQKIVQSAAANEMSPLPDFLTTSTKVTGMSILSMVKAKQSTGPTESNQTPSAPLAVTPAPTATESTAEASAAASTKAKPSKVAKAATATTSTVAETGRTTTPSTSTKAGKSAGKSVSPTPAKPTTEVSSSTKPDRESINNVPTILKRVDVAAALKLNQAASATSESSTAPVAALSSSKPSTTAPASILTVSSEPKAVTSKSKSAKATVTVPAEGKSTPAPVQEVNAQELHDTVRDSLRRVFQVNYSLTAL
jgi:hypothetical protein